MLRVYMLDSCRLLESVSVAKYGNFTDLGVNGFDIVRNGNSYDIFFLVKETISYTVPFNATGVHTRRRGLQTELLTLNETLASDPLVDNETVTMVEPEESFNTTEVVD